MRLNRAYMHTKAERTHYITKIYIFREIRKVSRILYTFFTIILYSNLFIFEFKYKKNTKKTILNILKFYSRQKIL